MQRPADFSPLISGQPNVIRVVDYGESPEPFYIVPYYERGTLQDFLEGEYHEDVIPKVVLQLLLGIREFHARGFVHRDIKEENVLVGDGEDLNLILADPDMMKADSNGTLKTFCGTPLYAAPEVWPGRSQGYGAPADMWSFGVCVMRCFYNLPHPSDPLPGLTETKKLIAWNSTWCETALQHLQDLDENDDQIIDILKLALQSDPAERSSANQCLERGCQNRLFRKNRSGEVVLFDAIESNTGANTPTYSGFPHGNVGDGIRTPVNKSLGVVNSPNVSTVYSRDECSGDPTQVSVRLDHAYGVKL